MRIKSIISTATAGIVAVTTFAIPSSAQASTTAAQNYLVLYKGSRTPNNAAAAIASAGGALVYSYSDIGVAIARATSDSFKTTLAADSNVEGVVDTARFAIKLDTDAASAGEVAAPLAPATDSDSLSGLQWDMVQIHTPEAHAITGGSPSVVVGDIDTGLDSTHPDLAPNFDASRSVNCVNGVPDNSPDAWLDDNGHGTHTAGTIAAASNGIGIVGVAPNVKIAGIKAGNADGFFFPEAVVCSFMWAATHGINVTNNSYFADPWLFNCKNDAEQRAIWNAERRAIQFAMKNKVTVVAAMGNQADDLAHPTQDATSPDDTSPVLRDIHNNCAVVPTEVAGVIGVTADGNLGFKSFYSSYGAGTADLMAPGGDSVLQLTAAAPNGRVLSAWPASLLTVTCLPARRLVDASGATYCYQQGTSMASPHVVGVAALIVSQFGHMAPAALRTMLINSADALPCPPDTSIYDFFPAVDNGAPQECTGGPAYNSFNGHGQVNALAAIS
jgi:subtilisin family serine protease